MSAPTTTNAQLHKSLISTLMAIDQLRDTLSRVTHIDRGDSGLQRCAQLIDDAYKHLAFEEQEQDIKEDDRV